MSQHRIDPVGGQALLGGVMMRSGRRWAAAVRRADGGIEVTDGEVPGIGGRWRDVPLVRGSLALVESLVVGLRATVWASDVRSTSAAAADGRTDGGLSKVGIAVSLVLGVALAVGLFGLAPAVVAELVGPEGSLAFNVFETVVRVGFLVAYLLVLGRSAELRRVFAYHGAEHMAVNAHEAGDLLTPAVVRGHSRRHGRCGTTFLLMVAVLATAVHLVVGRPSWPLLLTSRLVLLPVVAGLAYELIRFTTRPAAGRPSSVARRAGFLLQDLTTRTPDDDQIEVAVVALRAALDSAAKDGAATAGAVT